MNKYIDAEKLIAEIEKLLAKAKNDEEKAFTKKDAAGHLAAVTKTAVCVKIKKLIATLQQGQPEFYFYCKYGGTMPLCSDCKRNHNNSSFKTEEITSWYVPSNGTKHCIDYIPPDPPEVDLEEEIFEAEKKYGDIDEMGGYQILLFDDEFRDILRHFYELGINARKEE